MIRDTIKNHKDFAVEDSDPTAKCHLFIIRMKPAKFPDDPRYGLIVTKKMFKHAVDRNRAKRLLRDWIAHSEKMLCPEWDYIFVVRRDILNATRKDGRTAMKKALHYLRKEYGKQKQSV